MKQILIILGLFMSLSLSAQTIWHVDASASSGGTGLSWGQALPTLKQALALTSAGDQVWVAKGTYLTHADPATGAPTYNKLMFFHIPSGVSIYGGFDGTESVLTDRKWWANRTILTTSTSSNPVNYGVRLFAMSSNSNIIIDGFTLEKTYQSASGSYGNVMSAYAGSELIMANCVIREHFVKQGGRGLFQVYNADIQVYNCLMYNNEGSHGAIALAIGSGSVLAFSNCTVVDNVSHVSINHSLSNGSIVYNNSIIWNSGSVPGIGASYNHCITDFTTGSGSSFTQNPNLTSAPEYRLQAGSIALDNGNSGLNPYAYDLHQEDRVVNGQIDIGAIEFEGAGPEYWYSQVAGNLPASPSCPVADDPVYWPVETSVCKDNGLVAGGNLEELITSFGLTCDKGLGKTDLKIVRTDVLGNEVFHRVYGTTYDDKLVRVLENGSGKIIAIGNTDKEGENEVFILTINPTTGAIIGQVTFEGIQVNNAIRWPGTKEGFLLTGVEDDHAFLIKLLVSGNSHLITFKGRVPDAGSIGNALTVDESADTDQERIVVVGESNGNGKIWSIDLKAGSPVFTEYYSLYNDPFTTVLEDGGKFYLGDNAGEILKLNNDFSSVDFALNSLELGGKSHWGHVADLEMWGNNLLVHIAKTSVDRDPWLLSINKETGAIENNAHLRYTSSPTLAQLFYRNQTSNKFDIDQSGALCMNTGYFASNIQGTPPFSHQDRSIFIHRIPFSMESACSWYPVVASYKSYTESATFVTNTGIVASNPVEETTSWESFEPLFEGEMLCESAHCDQDLTDIEVLSNGQSATIATLNQPNISCDGLLAFDGPSETMVLTTTVPFASYYWVLSSGAILTGATVHLPVGVTKFTLYALDEEGCPHRIEYCIRSIMSYDDGAMRERMGVGATTDALSTLQVYPNPSTGVFQLQLPEGEFTQVVVTTLSGSVVLRQAISGNGAQQVEINLNEQPAGVYLLQITGDTVLKPQRLIKQ